MTGLPARKLLSSTDEPEPALNNARPDKISKLGLLAASYYDRPDAESFTGVLAKQGHLRCLRVRCSVRESGATIFVNFERRWSKDFTLRCRSEMSVSSRRRTLNQPSLPDTASRYAAFPSNAAAPWIEV